MATPTPTIRPIPTTFVSCVAEREQREPAGRISEGSGTPAAPFGLHALWRAYQACRKGKRQTRDTQRYEAGLLDHLVATRDTLASARWRPSPLLCFIVDQPKLREIHAAPFADRVVHHLLVERLARLYEPVFIHDSCANRKGKGTHFAVDRLQQFMRAEVLGSRESTRPQRHALQLDIANFFNRIHRPTLFRLIQHRLARAVRRQGLSPDEARALQAHCRALLTGNPAANARKKGPAAGFARVPPHKRLSGQEAGYGLPIGNLTSQFFANVYLNELDQFVKHVLKVRGYVRYVDDFVLVADDPAQLLAWREAIERFLAERLHLSLKARNEPRPVADGVDFLGYIVRPGYRLVRRRVVRRLWAALAAFERAHVRANALRLPGAARELLRAQVASYRAHFAHAHAWRLWQRTLARFSWLHSVFDFGAGDDLAHPPRPRWQPASVSGLGSQIRHFARDYPAACVLVEVGNRWRLIAPAGVPAESASVRATPYAPGWSGAPRRKHPWGGSRDSSTSPLYEFRTAELPVLRRRLKRAGIAHLLVAQEGHLRSGFKRRVLRLVWRPAEPESAVPQRAATFSESSLAAFRGHP